MAVLPVLLILIGALAAESTTRNVSTILFDLTRDAMELLPSLRQSPKSGDDSKETLAATALKRLDNILGTIRKADRYEVLKTIENRDSGGLLGRIADSLRPVLNPLRIMTSHVAGNKTISKLSPDKKKE